MGFQSHPIEDGGVFTTHVVSYSFDARVVMQSSLESRLEFAQYAQPPQGEANEVQKIRESRIYGRSASSIPPHKP
jgi:hypothetical protein